MTVRFLNEDAELLLEIGHKFQDEFNQLMKDGGQIYWTQMDVLPDVITSYSRTHVLKVRFYAARQIKGMPEKVDFRILTILRNLSCNTGMADGSCSAELKSSGIKTKEMSAFFWLGENPL